MKDALYLKSFPKEEYILHLEKLQAGMEESEIDLLLLSTPENIYYATGYRSWYLSSLFRPVLVMVPRKGEPSIYLRILEKTTVENTGWCPHIYCSGSPGRRLGERNAECPAAAVRQAVEALDFEVKTVGLEMGEGLQYFWPLSTLMEIRQAFEKTFTFTDGSMAVWKARMVKTPWEVERIRTAGYVTERAICDTFRTIRAGVTTEKDISRGIAARMAESGVDRISYLTVNSGKDKYHTFNSYATDRVVREGEIVLVDISGHIDGYASDLTRVMYLGRRPPETYLRMAEIAGKCVHEGLKLLRPGVRVSEVNRYMEEFINHSPLGNGSVHSSGHSIGLNVTEYPNIADEVMEIIRPGMVFALENGVYPYDPEIGASSISISFRMEDEAVACVEGGEWLSGPGKALYTYEDFI